MTAQKRSTSVDIDLDALRKGRADGNRDKTIKYKGKIYPAPARLPVYFAVLMERDRAEDAMRLLFGDAAWDEMVCDRDFDQDLFEQAVNGLYGEAMGESSGSDA